MKILEVCGCFPTGKHYPGIAHLIHVRAVGVASEVDHEAPWHELVIAFIDTETTGRDSNVDRLVEIGVVLGRSGDVFERRSWLVDPGSPIPPESTAIHGIRDEDVRGKPTFGQVLPEILAFLGGAIPAAYNAAFDKAFVISEVARAKAELTDLPPALRNDVDWLDPLVFARELYKEEQSRALGEMAQRLGIALERAHRATDDAEAALRVLYAFGKDPRVPRGYAALVREQRRLGRMHDEARRFWKKN